MNRILLVGNHSFTTSVIAQVRGLDALLVKVASNALEATRLIESFIPDVVITQAAQLIEDSVLKTFNQEHRSLYFVVIEDRGPHELSCQSSTRSPTCPPIHPVLSGRSPEQNKLEQRQVDLLTQLPVEMMPPQLLEAFQLEKTAIALEAGADAYLWLRPLGLATAATTFNQALSPAPQRLKHAPPIKFNQSQCRLMQAHIQLGLNRAQRYRDLSQINSWLSAIALVDALTQLSNRRAFDLELPRQIKLARTKGAHFSLMVLDIDYFKTVNDRYGHLIGDEVLKHVAKRLSANMRFYDTPFRYGGEEFIVTLSNTDVKEAAILAERLRHAIARKPFDLTHLVSAPGEEHQLPLTLSIGLTELRVDDDDQGRSFLDRADQNLLQAKDAGRNQVVSD